MKNPGLLGKTYHNLGVGKALVEIKDNTAVLKNKNGVRVHLDL